jgi:hypothetical protein
VNEYLRNVGRGCIWVVLMVLGGCGSISTQQLQPTLGPSPLGLPDQIVVMPFETGDTAWGLEVSAGEEAVIKQGLPSWLVQGLTEKLQSLAPAVAQSESALGAGRVWLVQGRIKRVLLPDPKVPESLRKPVLETTVFVFDPSRSRVQPFLSYDIQAQQVKVDPLAPVEEKEGQFLELEVAETARLLEESLRAYVKSRGW